VDGELPSSVIVLSGTERDRAGRFLPGNRVGRSANPTGRPRTDPELKEIRRLARSLATEAAPTVVEALYEVATQAPLNSMARVNAARTLLEYGLGMPTPRELVDDAERIEFKFSMGEDVIDAEDAEIEELAESV
jgi:hypothetical protein